MQDTPCDFSTSPSPAPTINPPQDMATNTLQIPSPRIMKPEEERSVNISNNTKEDNQTKDSNSISHDKCSQERIASLVQNNVNLEGGQKEIIGNYLQENIHKEDTQYACPICDTILFSSHDFTIHIRSHSDILFKELNMFTPAGKGFMCRLCNKVLSSANSLERHILTHSAENPFMCKVCGVSFSTHGNLYQHMKSHRGRNCDNFNYDSDASSESLGSVNTESSSTILLNLKKRIVTRTSSEFNNNNIELTPPNNNGNAKRKSDMDDVSTVRKRKCDSKKYTSDKFDCSLCDKTGFITLNLLETHIEECHPEYKAKCDPCNLIFKNHRVLNLHRYMAHHSNQHALPNGKQATIGFKDLTFVDFSSEKFPHIARMVCEQSLHHASSLYHRFQCDKCDRAFPCESALKIHQQCCGQENYASSGESLHQDNDLSSSDNEAPTDLSGGGKRFKWSESKSESSDEVEDDRKRDTFFAGLDLQNNSVLNISDQDMSSVKERFRKTSYLKPNNECKDLADIQSIISVASVGGLLHDLSKSPQPTVLEVTPPDSGSRAAMYDSAVTDEEDCFAAEFRKMKLRGEFPCRLCTAVFPNLRALKGHNRVHLTNNGGPNGEPYRCNMCSHSSLDKSALIRHMRTHNGDRPYECALCHYAFTTKANCERHLRNRHAKMTRDEVKKSIIYHPSEDHSNEIEQKPSRDDVKRSLFCEKESTRSAENKDIIKAEKIPNVLKTFEQTPTTVFESIHTHLPSAFKQVQKLTYVEDGLAKGVGERRSLDVGTMTYEENESLCSFASDTNDKTGGDGDLPLDLSMDVLDLSKKKNNKIDNVCKESSESDEETEPQDLSKKTIFSSVKNCYPLNIDTKLERATKLPQHLPSGFSQELNKTTSPHQLYDRESVAPTNQAAMPQLDMSKFYPASAHPFYLRNNTYSPFPSTTPLQPGPYSPYFVPPPPPVIFPPNANHEFVEMKERLQKELIRGLQLTSGGSLVLDQIAMANAAERIQSLHQQAMAEFNWRMENSSEENTLYSPSLNKEVKPTVHIDNEKEIKSHELNLPKVSEKVALLKPKQDTTSSVKMVIKNGVLIPKQKQRRYRTERPFSCEHCSARFTLRSNMERHIKQQHPQFWSQRQRNAASIPARRNNSISTKNQPTLLNHGQFPSHSGMYSLKSEDELSRSSVTNDHININDRESKPNVIEGKPCISVEVKNAIAQQLKSKLSPSDTNIEVDNEDDLMDEEEDEDLVIDEEVKDEETSQIENTKKIEVENIRKKMSHNEENQDLASVPRLIDNLDNASNRTFRQYFHSDEDHPGGEGSEEDEEGLVAAGSTSEGCNSGSDENRSEPENNSGNNPVTAKKKSAYSLAPNRVSCPYCFRKFPWSSSLRRHVLTHTGQKPYKCSFCPLLFTTKSNCDRHLLRKHGGRIPTTTAESQPSNDSTLTNSNAPNYTMRNVPERPYKCKSCPSSTFSTLSNLKKHLSTKHNTSTKGEGTQSGYESHGSVSEEIDVGENEQCKLELDKEKRIVSDPREIHPGHSELTNFMKTNPPSVEHNFVVTPPSDLPFKCHLCEGSFSERQEALDHIRDNHCPEFQLLVSKGALETGAMTEDTQGPDEAAEESVDTLRGKFPDYANRKVMCAFCLRRFWSAEDLRRHMRTHTGERPFSCDICRRRFTLKHSMLRHRKKHSFPHNSTAEETSPASDEDVNGTNSSSTTLNNNNISDNKSWMKSRMEEESDLISNLLGIQDKTIVDKMLISKSADDAAKLLGVQK